MILGSREAERYDSRGAPEGDENARHDVRNVFGLSMQFSKAHTVGHETHGNCRRRSRNASTKSIQSTQYQKLFP